MDADGVVSSNFVSENLRAKYGLDQVQADLIASAALGAITGVGKAKYQPNKGAVGNMGEFFKQSGFGGQMKTSSQKPTKYFRDKVFIRRKELSATILLKVTSTTLMASTKIILKFLTAKEKSKQF